MTWRGWAGYTGLGSAAALAWRGDRAAAALAGACVLLVFAAWVRRELLATRTRMREGAEMTARLDAAVAARPVPVRGHYAAPHDDDEAGATLLL